MYIVRKPRGEFGTGTSYLVEATSGYRLGKVAVEQAKIFSARSTARRWAKRVEGVVVRL